jgi:ABC-type bacteriocin/lantibiotic exporter with double-glycine peptidase domain
MVVDNLVGKNTVIVLVHRIVTISSSNYIYVIKNGCFSKSGIYDKRSIVYAVSFA